MRDELRAVGERFEIPGRFRDAQPFGRGHIHETFVASWEHGGAAVRYLHQRINRRVFPDPARVVDNLTRVTAHLRAALSGTNSLPIVLTGTEDLVGMALPEASAALRRLVQRQANPMRSSAVPAHQRRDAAAALAARLLRQCMA